LANGALCLSTPKHKGKSGTAVIPIRTASFVSIVLYLIPDSSISESLLLK
jgi:hypothetical protein